MAMDGGDRLRRRRSLQERLGLSCCGSTWDIGSSNISIHNSNEDNDLDLVDPLAHPDCVSASPRMNLAAALAAERQARSTVVVGGEGLTLDIENDDTNTSTSTSTSTIRGTGTRMSLMRLLEETDDQDEKEVGRDQVCCVCMGRKKGAAFIPCGHTFCRVCSRELWLNRGSCPLCNRSILEVLDIF